MEGGRKKLYEILLHLRIMNHRQGATADLAADAIEREDEMNWLRVLLTYWRRWSEVI
jgi:hypothetical protein